ncbi:hypothetical protein [Caldinitratiruptor microaerophilus]|uniref:Uncharacterized protein n=1 Tax=Caldinitratiruptor microaerophilus TaxID=671077 RepID=A0AA35CHK3_9FIRM|nr:hypothetical protein [Caldinitratiruptor microaerophilus]BDG59017.1 hypothetical protein caldi_01070 [Caldinitratiruptor microaerophilus]
MCLPVPLRELRSAQVRRTRRQLVRLALRWAAAVATAGLVVWGSAAAEASAAGRPGGAAPGARLAPVDAEIRPMPAGENGQLPPAGPGPRAGAADRGNPRPGRPETPGPVRAAGSGPEAGGRDVTLPVRIAQTLLRAVQMPLNILAEGLRPSGQPSPARIFLALWSGTGLAGPLLPDGPAQDAVDAAYTAGSGLSTLTARFLEHVASTDAALRQTGIPGARGLAWAITVRRAVGLGLRHAFDLRAFARSLRPSAVLAAVRASPGNWAATLGRIAGMAGGVLGVALGVYRAVEALRRRRAGEDGYDRAVRAAAGLLAAAAGVLGIVVVVSAHPATAAGAAFLATVLGIAALLLENRRAGRRLANAVRAAGRAASGALVAGRARGSCTRVGAAPACRREPRPGGPLAREAPGEPPTVFRLDRDGVLVASEPGARFSLEGKNRVWLPPWVQERLREAGGAVIAMWGDRAAAAVFGGSPPPRGRSAGGIPANLPVARWLASRWDAWVPIVEPGTTEVLLGRYDAEGCYTGRWRVVIAPDGTITAKRWIAHRRPR